MNNLFFKVAGAGFRLLNEMEDDIRPLIPSYAPFHQTDSGSDDCMFVLTLADGKVTEAAEGTSLGLFDSGDAKHEVYRLPEGGYLMFIRNHDDQLTCGLRTNADFSDCEASVYGNEDDRKFGLNNALMVAFAFAGAYHNILLMHASVIMNAGYGYLFLGKSGTGKSTHSRLWLKYIVGSDLLNDDNPAVRYDEATDSVTVYGTPWSGKTPCYRNESVPVGAYLRLQQFPENIIHHEPGVKAFASVLSSCSTMIWDKPSYDSICNTVSRIAERIPVYRLQCRPDEEAARLSYSNISHKETL